MKVGFRDQRGTGGLGQAAGDAVHSRIVVTTPGCARELAYVHTREKRERATGFWLFSSAFCFILSVSCGEAFPHWEKPQAKPGLRTRRDALSALKVSGQTQSATPFLRKALALQG